MNEPSIVKGGYQITVASTRGGEPRGTYKLLLIEPRGSTSANGATQILYRSEISRR